MLNHTGTLWHYLGSFVLYTLLAIGCIYAAYCYFRKSPGGSMLPLGRKAEKADPNKLTLESVLPLEPRKTLYVVRSGPERFLISASGDDTALLSKLEPVPSVVEILDMVPEDTSDRPWYTERPNLRVRKQTMGERFRQSVQWLVSSRSR